MRTTRHLISAFVRLLNLTNPSTHGRNFVAYLAERCGALPPCGTYEIGPGLVMAIDPSEYIERAIYFNSFEVLFEREMLARLSPGAVFVDIGANIGYYTLKARSAVGPSGMVFAIEPTPHIFAQLERNLTLNSYGDVRLCNVALSDVSGTATIFYSAGASHGEASLRHQGWAGATACEVPTALLDDLLPIDLPRLDVMKLDVEGAEAHVLTGAKRTILRYRPTVFAEINPSASAKFGRGPLEAITILLDLYPQYTVYRIDTHRITKVSVGAFGPIRNCNVLLVP